MTEPDVRLPRVIREAGVYIDPCNRERARFMAGEIDVEEFERRVGELLGVVPDPTPEP